MAADADAEEEGEVDPESEEQRKSALRKQRKDQISYLKLHRGKLEKVAQRCVNRVLLSLPPDPCEALLFQLSAHVKASGIFFSRFRIMASGSDQIVVEVVADARSAKLSPHRMVLARESAARGLATAAAPTAVSLEEAEAQELFEVVERVRATFGSLLVGVNVLDYQEIYARLGAALPGNEEDESADQAAALFRAYFAGELLEAGACLMDCTTWEAVRAGILEFGGVHEEEEEECVASAITCQKDLEVWQKLWPEICYPVRQGSTARRRVFLCVNLWAALLPDAQELFSGSGRTVEYVDEVAETSRQQALAELNLEEIDQDELPEPEPHEYCPPLNAVHLALSLSHALAAKVGPGSIEDGEDFVGTLSSLRKQINTTLPKYELNETRLKEIATAEFAERQKAAAAARFAKSQSQEAMDAESDDESMESEKDPIVLLQEEQQQSSVYFSVHLDADAAYDAEGDVYSFAEGTKMDQGQLIDYYATLCEGEPLLKCLIAPFSPRDPKISTGLQALRSKLPEQVAIVDEAFAADALPIPAQEEEEEEEEDSTPQEASERDGVGRLRDSRLSVFGLATQRIRLLKARHGHHGLCTKELGRDTVLDFGASEEMLSSVGSLMDYLLVTPDRSRRLLLPTREEQELQSALAPLGDRIRAICLTAYRAKKSTDKRKTSKDLKKAQFCEGLRRLGYKYVDEYAAQIFDFVDQSSNDSISPTELRLLELVDGAGSLEDLDRLRIWLCEWKARRARHAKEKMEALRLEREERGEEGETEEHAAQVAEAEAEAKESPLAELWQYMDRDGSGEASFSEFRRALRKAKHPAGLNPNKGPALELFMCLDIQVDGSIVEGEFYCFSILSAYFQLERVERVRTFLEDRFGNLKAAFKYMDADRSGSLTTQEWMDFMMGPQGYADEEDVKVCFFFIDKDFSGQLTSKEFEFLGNFDGRDFVNDVAKLRDYLVEKYENLEDAFDAFEQKMPPLDMGGTDLSQIPEKKRKRREGRGLSGNDFVNCCRMCNFKGRFDPRLLFNFLDASHVGHITRNEFLQLGKLGAVEALRISSERMRNGISTLKHFIFHEVELEEPITPQEDDKWKWAGVHKALREVTQDDLELAE